MRASRLPLGRPGFGAVSALVMALVSGALVSGASSPAPPAPAEIDLRRYELTFDEPFDRLDASAWGPGTRWIAHTPWHGDFGDARFVDPGATFPFRIDKGFLTITMTRRDGVWQSGLLSSGDSQSRGFLQSGGYFEVRARLPGGSGVWPAIWLGSNPKPGQGNPEIDIMEYYGHDPASYRATVHVWREGKSEYGQDVKIDVPARSLERRFHLYGVSIDASAVVFYLDRREVGRLPSRPEYLQPMFLMINLAAGGGWPIDGMPDPSAMVVDYARAYRRR